MSKQNAMLIHTCPSFQSMSFRSGEKTVEEEKELIIIETIMRWQWQNTT